MAKSELSLAIVKAREPFQKISRQTQEHNRLVFEREAEFALQIVKSTEALRDVSPDSVMHSLIQVATMGLTLNPTESLCYLIPYGNRCYPSPSYRGLVALSTRHKAVKWVQADVVYEKDQFSYRLGTTCEVIHTPHLGRDRGKRICAYVVWRTGSGDIRADILPDEELVKMEQAAERKNKGKQTPAYKWWRDEMAKKSAIRRASKLWDKSAPLSTAISIMDKYESGITVDSTAEKVPTISEAQLDALNAEIKSPAILTKLLSAYKIEKLAELLATDFDEAMARVKKAQAEKSDKAPKTAPKTVRKA